MSWNEASADAGLAEVDRTDEVARHAPHQIHAAVLKDEPDQARADEQQHDRAEDLEPDAPHLPAAYDEIRPENEKERNDKGSVAPCPEQVARQVVARPAADVCGGLVRLTRICGRGGVVRDHAEETEQRQPAQAYTDAIGCEVSATHYHASLKSSEVQRGKINPLQSPSLCSGQAIRVPVYSS